MAVLGVIYQIISPTKPLFGTWKWAAVLGGAVLRGTTVVAFFEKIVNFFIHFFLLFSPSSPERGAL